MSKNIEQLNVVFAGHVDHGKSTVIGRLLSDTGFLPKDKIESIRSLCKVNSKPFEYAFLLDALKDERSQGITIDSARCFFKSKKRDYIIIDAPGHIELLKNMITGAARADAAVIIIDANEGVQENSKRHGYALSFLGIKNVVVCINKMDLADYSEEVFNSIKAEYSNFLDDVGLVSASYIPVSARNGENIVNYSKKMFWYQGGTVLEALDKFPKFLADKHGVFRMPVQDIYKFSENGNDKRIFAGRIVSGKISVGDDVVFFPSEKTSRIKSVEAFNLPEQTSAIAGQSTGVTLETQVYIKPGEVMSKVSECHPKISNRLKVNIFWMGKQSFIKKKKYKIKINAQQVPVVLDDLVSVLDASNLQFDYKKTQVDRHDVADCILETTKPVAFDDSSTVLENSRFVIVDDYEIVACGTVLSAASNKTDFLKNEVEKKTYGWVGGSISSNERISSNKHKSGLILITGQPDTGKLDLGRVLEQELFLLGKSVYF